MGEEGKFCCRKEQYFRRGYRAAGEAAAWPWDLPAYDGGDAAEVIVERTLTESDVSNSGRAELDQGQVRQHQHQQQGGGKVQAVPARTEECTGRLYQE